ncbi:hypothetical protein, partial [Candidatus Chloroploca sp. Khr17]|uniref:hypothetical protein n=1 Tax=Candidatus Chloroploca sp. Khr17 TaxID=2496869 RepID=UPI00196B5B63
MRFSREAERAANRVDLQHSTVFSFQLANFCFPRGGLLDGATTGAIRAAVDGLLSRPVLNDKSRHLGKVAG